MVCLLRHCALGEKVILGCSKSPVTDLSVLVFFSREHWKHIFLVENSILNSTVCVSFRYDEPFLFYSLFPGTHSHAVAVGEWTCILSYWSGSMKLFRIFLDLKMFFKLWNLICSKIWCLWQCTWKKFPAIRDFWKFTQYLIRHEKRFDEQPDF